MIEVYCGPAPTPGSLPWAWNFDIVALGVCAAIFMTHHLCGDRMTRHAMLGSLAAIAALFLSPLCALTSALFSARVVHHILLVTLVAPMLALAFPARAGSEARVGIGWIVLLHSSVFWIWHAPAPYQFGIGGTGPYWLMQFSLLGSGAWLWRRVFDERETTGRVLFALLATIIQMGMLGALLTFAPTPLYAPHALTTMSFGLTPIEDQQLSGLVMWVPAALPYLAAAFYRVWPMLRLESTRQDLPWSG